MPAHPATSVERNRVFPVVAIEELDWVRSLCGPGGPFASEGHAVEAAVQRVSDEQRFIRQECKRTGTKFDEAAFWSLLEPHITASRPIVSGGRTGKMTEGPARRQIGASIDTRLQAWISKLVGRQFESTSHVIETCIRHLHSLDVERPVACLGFPFDAQALWKAYRQALKTV